MFCSSVYCIQPSCSWEHSFSAYFLVGPLHHLCKVLSFGSFTSCLELDFLRWTRAYSTRHFLYKLLTIRHSYVWTYGGKTLHWPVSLTCIWPNRWYGVGHELRQELTRLTCLSLPNLLLARWTFRHCFRVAMVQMTNWLSHLVTIFHLSRLAKM